MISNPKPAELLTVADFAIHPVWMFVGSDASGETLVRPIKRLPVKDLGGKLIGTSVCLANGDQVSAIIGNIDSSNHALTKHYLTISVERDGRRFHLARYFDVDYNTRGPAALAAFLRLRLDEVFPIAYDIRKYVVGGEASALVGSITSEPEERLTMDQLVTLAVPPLIDPSKA